MIRKNDIANNMRLSGYYLDICNHYCNNKRKKCNFYDWYTFLDGKFIKRMCESCALREVWGHNYKSKKGFKKWNSSQ